MAHKLPPLPYPPDALAPHISRETMEFHHGKHHKAYVEKLNSLIKGTEFENAPLEDIVQRADGGIYNNAAQHWNHTFFWQCLAPRAGGKPGDRIGRAIDASFGSFDKFKEKFSTEAANLFGSGWTWLVKRDDGALAIEPMSNADTPLRSGSRAVLTLDVWEHAYYIDYRNARPDFITAFWNVVNWEFAAANYEV
jgi:Fe-Mn family superoxide dismutase